MATAHGPYSETPSEEWHRAKVAHQARAQQPQPPAVAPIQNPNSLSVDSVIGGTAAAEAKRQALIEQTAMRCFANAYTFGDPRSLYLAAARDAWRAAEIFVDARPGPSELR